MTRQEKENLLHEAVDILIKLDNHLMTTRDNTEFAQWVEDLIENYCDELSCGEVKKAIEMCKSDVLDKIRAEIEALNPVDYVSMSSYEGHRGASDMKDDVLLIIDKYKAES